MRIYEKLKCRKCHQVFSPNRVHRKYCSGECAIIGEKEVMQMLKEKNKERYSQQRKDWREKNKLIAKKRFKDWYYSDEGQKFSKEYGVKYKKENQAKLRISAKVYRESNLEKVKASSRLWARNNPEKRTHNQKMRQWRKRNAEGFFSLQQWEELKKKYKYLCAMCKMKTILTIDHIIPLIKGGSNYIENIQPLCRSCNSKKGVKCKTLGVPVLK